MRRRTTLAETLHIVGAKRREYVDDEQKFLARNQFKKKKLSNWTALSTRAELFRRKDC